jgi:hypothetical protein
MHSGSEQRLNIYILFTIACWHAPLAYGDLSDRGQPARMSAKHELFDLAAASGDAGKLPAFLI